MPRPRLQRAATARREIIQLRIGNRVFSEQCLISLELIFVNVYAQKKPVTRKNAEVMSIAIMALVNTNASTAECLGA
jgi:hypothetical protein